MPAAMSRIAPRAAVLPARPRQGVKTARAWGAWPQRDQPSAARSSGRVSRSAVIRPSAACARIPASAAVFCSSESALLVKPSTDSTRLRRVAEPRAAMAPAAEPRLTSRPFGDSTRRAASAGTPQTGSSTRSTRSPAACASRPATASASSPVRSATASAPSSVARARPCGSRQAATTRPAPSRRAACTAIWPTLPLAPRTSTCSPGCSCPRQDSAIQAATAGSPRAAARSSLTPSGSASRAVSGTAQSSAIEPSPGAMPALQLNQTRWPAGAPSASATMPTPWVPGTYGSAGAPKYEVPEAPSRSSGLTGAAVTRIRAWPGPRPGTGCGPYRGGSPWRWRTAARMAGAPPPPPPCSAAGLAIAGIMTPASRHRSSRGRALVLGVGVGVGVLLDPGLRDLRVHALVPGVGAQLALEVVDRLLDHLPGLAEIHVHQAVVVLDHPAVHDNRVHVAPPRLEDDVAVRMEQREHHRRGVVLDQHDVRLLARLQAPGQRVHAQGLGPAPGGPVDHLLGAQVVVGHGLVPAVRLKMLAGPVRAQRGAHGREQVGAPPDAGVHGQRDGDAVLAQLPGGRVALPGALLALGGHRRRAAGRRDPVIGVGRQRGRVHVDGGRRHEAVVVHEPDAVVARRPAHAGVGGHRRAQVAGHLERGPFEELRVAGDVEGHLEAEHVIAAAEAPAHEVAELRRRRPLPRALLDVAVGEDEAPRDLLQRVHRGVRVIGGLQAV